MSSNLAGVNMSQAEKTPSLAVAAALEDFKAKVLAATGRNALAREVENFSSQVETALAHRLPVIIQMGLCDFQTLDGKATIIECRA